MLLQRGRTKCENLRTNERYEVVEAHDVTAFASSRAFCSTSTTNRYIGGGAIVKVVAGAGRVVVCALLITILRVGFPKDSRLLSDYEA